MSDLHISCMLTADPGCCTVASLWQPFLDVSSHSIPVNKQSNAKLMYQIGCIRRVFSPSDMDPKFTPHVFQQTVCDINTDHVRSVASQKGQNVIFRYVVRTDGTYVGYSKK